MKERRALVEGLQPSSELNQREKEFVYGKKEEEPPKASVEESQTEKPATPINTDNILPQYRGRVPFTTRCRPELASALKRASLKRQLAGIEPNHIQDILEQAIENWLRANDQMGE